MPVTSGEAAPGFTLYDTEKKRISLSDYRGKNVVLLFFPFAFSRVCSKELCEVRDNYNFYEKLDVTVIAISVDSLYTNAKFKELNNFRFLLLSDFNKDVSRRYDSLIEHFAYDYHGVSKRSTFVIDKAGRIVYEEILANPGDYPDMQKLKDTITSLN